MEDVYPSPHKLQIYLLIIYLHCVSTLDVVGHPRAGWQHEQVGVLSPQLPDEIQRFWAQQRQPGRKLASCIDKKMM
jgi:hypothetical protein